MNDLQTRIDLLSRLGQYMLSGELEWREAQERALSANPWFTPGHIILAVENIVEQYLQKEKLTVWANKYKLPESIKTVGIVMAGNIPLVGFHDFLCGFISGHKLKIKLSSKDDVLLRHLAGKLIQWDTTLMDDIQFADTLKNCDAYIATGTGNTAPYFEQYFGKYPHIIRKNRTSVAILDGTETNEELRKLADDVFSYYGLGCRNVSQIYIPKEYDLTKLLEVFTTCEDFMQHHKYKNNYDYYLTLYLLNKVPYLTNGSVLMVENEMPFSAVSVLHYCFYTNKEATISLLKKGDHVQAIIGKGFTTFGASQKPALDDYADGVDTMVFLCSL